MGGQIVWLEGRVDWHEVGARAAALAQLRGASLQVPRAFALGRSLLARYVAQARDATTQRVPANLPPDIQQEIAQGVIVLGGAYCIRRSPLEGEKVSEASLVATRGGRPERETYINLTDPSEVVEAVRRVWGGVVVSHPPAVGIVVQQFIAPDVCAIVRRDSGDVAVLHVTSSLGIGDLLAAGLVVPDRHSLRKGDGTVITQVLGRKAQMTVPHPDGGIMRIPVPPKAARKMALDPERLAELARLWRAAEEVLGQVHALGAALCGGRWHVTGVVPAAGDDGVAGAVLS